MQIIPRDLRVAVWNESDTHRITRFPFSFLPFYFYCVYSGTENESARKRERERDEGFRTVPGGVLFSPLLRRIYWKMYFQKPLREWF